MIKPGLTFNEIAQDYDRCRSAYPADFIKTVLDVVGVDPVSNICEIGCGSGQASIRLAEAGVRLTCVEPGSALLDLARTRLKDFQNVSFLASTFDEANLPINHFDIVFAANALHWVAEEKRYAKPFAILKPGGYLLSVWRWNHPLSGTLGERINTIFAEDVPLMKFETRAEYESGALSHFNDLVASGLYWLCQVRRMPYGWEKSGEDYVKWISTWSQLAALSDQARIEVCRRVKEEIDSAGGKIYESGETVIISGQKPDEDE